MTSASNLKLLIVTQNRKHKRYSKAAKKKHAVKSWKTKRANLREAVVTLHAKKKDLLKDYRVIRSERKSIVSKILQLEIKCQLDETGATRKLYKNKTFPTVLTYDTCKQLEIFNSHSEQKAQALQQSSQKEALRQELESKESKP